MAPVPDIGNWVDRLLPGKRTIRAGFCFCFLPHSMQDLSPPDQDQTLPPHGVSTTDQQGSFCSKVSFEISPRLM